MEVTSLQEKLSPLEQHSPKKFQNSSVMKFATFNIKQMWLLLLCRIETDYLLVKECELPISKETMSIVTVYIPSPYDVFLYFLKGQVHNVG